MKYTVCPKCKVKRNPKIVAFCPVCKTPEQYKLARKEIGLRRKEKRRAYYLKHREEIIAKAREYRKLNKVFISRKNKLNHKRRDKNKIRCKERYYRIKSDPIAFRELMKKLWQQEKAKRQLCATPFIKT